MFFRYEESSKAHRHTRNLLAIIYFLLTISAYTSGYTKDNPSNRNVAKSLTNEINKTPSTSNAQEHSLGKKKGFVKIATIGPQPPVVNSSLSPQQVVETIIDFWSVRFSRVLPEKPDIIVVPEACDWPRGLDQEKLNKYYLVRKNQVKDYFAKVATENNCYVVYSAKREMQDGSWRNSSVLLNRKGEVAGIYNKNHPTIKEMKKGVLSGKDAPIIECDFGRVALAICFDLNFDELREKYIKAKPDLIVFSSMYHGGMMQAYWAFSCRSHFVGAIAGYATPSQIRNPLGEIIASNTNHFDYTVGTVNLDCAIVHLDENWERLRAMNAKYGEKVKITDPGLLGSVLISSEHDKISIEEMIDEFEIERLDDYFKRSLNYRYKPGNMEQ